MLALYGIVYVKHLEKVEAGQLPSVFSSGFPSGFLF